MAYRSFHVPNFTPTATADAAAMANGTYMAIKGGSGTQRNNIKEIKADGWANTSAPTLLQFARHSTIATTPTALAAPASDGPLDPATAALAAPPISFTAAAAGGQRSAAVTDARLTVGLNAWGGIMRWLADLNEQFVILGNTAPFGEASLSAFTGGTVGAISAHIIYEPM